MLSSKLTQERFEKFESSKKINHAMVLGNSFIDVGPDTILNTP